MTLRQQLAIKENRDALIAAYGLKDYVDYFAQPIEQGTPLPTVTYRCACGKEICTVSLNVGGMDGTTECPCGIRFVFSGSLTPRVERPVLPATPLPTCNAGTSPT